VRPGLTDAPSPNTHIRFERQVRAGLISRPRNLLVGPLVTLVVDRLPPSGGSNRKFLRA
jgi:hypothetical protein